MPYSTTDANGEPVHLQFKGMVVGETSGGRVSIASLFDRTERLLGEGINRGGHPLSGAHDNRLTDRERSIASLIVKGLTNKQISGKLGISRRTVENHRANIRRKLNLNHRSTSITDYLSKY